MHIKNLKIVFFIKMCIFVSKLLMENHLSLFTLTNCDVILNKLLVVCIAYVHKHILDFILLYLSGHYGMYTYSSEILNILKSVINQCLPIFSKEIIFLKCNLGRKTHEKK